jgi:hypothetical protein
MRPISTTLLALLSASAARAAPVLQCTTVDDGSDSSSSGGRGGGGGALAINPSLVPGFGVRRGVNAGAEQEGSCDGRNAAGDRVLIPCFCPPDRADFVYRLAAAVAAGRVLDQEISFSNDADDMSEETVRARATAAIVLLQSFNGTKGVGCPAASAPSFLKVQKNGRMDD